MSIEGQVIKSARHGMELTQVKFALKMGVSVGAVRHWEQGTRNPSKTVMKLLERIR